MKTLIFLILLVLLITACGIPGFTISMGAPTPTPSPTGTYTPTLTPTATPNAEATASAQAQATGTARAAALATREAEQTATARAEATTRAQGTATAAAQASATRGSLVNAINTLAQSGKRAYYSDRGEINATPPYVTIENAGGTSLRNFVIEVRFLNPGPNWAYQLGFRDSGPYSHYRLVVNSSSQWGLIMPTENGGPNTVQTKTIASGVATGVDLSPSGSNQVRLVVNDKAAFLFLNGQYVSAMDVSERNTSGGIWIGSGTSFRYENFLVSALP